MKIIVYFSAVLVALVVIFFVITILGPSLYLVVVQFFAAHAWVQTGTKILGVFILFAIFVWAWADSVGAGLPSGKPWKML
jgi:hypothetical protein